LSTPRVSHFSIYWCNIEAEAIPERTHLLLEICGCKVMQTELIASREYELIELAKLREESFRYTVKDACQAHAVNA
jgi:hypothetical protein